MTLPDVDPTAARLLLDQGVPRDAAVALRLAGVDCSHVAELGISTATDAAILELARRQNAVIVTLDADFHADLAVSGARKPSVIRLRMQGLRAAAVTRIVLAIVTEHSTELAQGCLNTAKRQKITAHKLPIGSGT